MVSNAIGGGNSNAVFHIIGKVNRMGMFISLVIIVIALLIPEVLLRIYTNQQSLIDDALPVLYVVIGALIPMTISINWFSGVSGTANTKMALAIEACTIAIYLAYVFLIILVVDASLPVVWLSEYVYVIILGLFSFLYLKYGKWRGRKI